MEPEKLKALIKASQQTKKLDLSYGGLDGVPPEVAKLRHLEVLDLSNNNITDLPEEMFKNNGTLVELDVSRNNLQSLPESLGEIYLSLRNLNASSNMLKTIPSSMVGYFASLMQTVYTRYGFYHEYSSKKRIINLADNLDLDIKDMIASDRGQDIGNLLERRREQEKEQKAAQEHSREQTKQVGRELRVEEKKDRQRERKNSEKSRTKNLRMDRNE